jgi:hypothetical protein
MLNLDRPMPTPIDPSPADYPDQRDVVTLCAWCPGIHILRYHLEPLQTLVIFVNDRKETSIYRAKATDDPSGYTRLIVSHGICDQCRAKNFPPVIDESKVERIAPEEASL